MAYKNSELWSKIVVISATRQKITTKQKREHRETKQTLSDPATATGGAFFSGWTTTVKLELAVCPPVSVTFNTKV